MSQKPAELSAQFTPAARDALNWWTDKMPEGGYQAFCAEMERAAAEVMERYGFDEQIMGSFQVLKIFAFKRS
ncbi:hypothetical protein [Enterobacter soli]|uniref:hypothetical protein n=1 Tax=Enterobacter soli TaxID=885040 RepID=UPI002F41622F